MSPEFAGIYVEIIKEKRGSNDPQFNYASADDSLDSFLAIKPMDSR